MSGEPTFLFLRRRRLLKLGIAGVAAVGAGAGGLVALRGSAPAVDAGITMLSAHEYRTMRAIALAQLPPGGPSAAGADELAIARTFDGFLAGEGPEVVGDLKTALALVEYGPVLFGARLTTFSNLAPAEREAHWRSWVESDLALRRQVATAFRKFILLVGYDRPELWPAIGYTGPSLWGMPR